MADTLPPVVIELKLQAEQMQAQLKAVTAQLEQVGAKAQEQKPRLEGMTGALKGVASAFVAFEGFEFLKKSAEVAVENAKGFNLMALQLQNSAGATREQSKAADENLEKLSEMSAVLITDIRPNFAKLVAVTHDTTEAMKLQKIAMDVSAGTSKNLSVVTMALARAHEGNYMALNKLTPGIKNATDKMKYLEDTYGGMAETAASSDPFARMKVSIEGLQKAFGDVLLPILSQAVGFITNLIESIKPFIPLIMGVVAAFAAYKIAMMGVAAAQALYNGVVALSTIATEGFTLALASTGIGAIIIGVGLLTAALLGLNAAVGGGAQATNTAAVNAGEAARKKAEDAFKKANPGKTSTYFEYGKKQTYTALSPAEMQEMKRVGQEAYDRAVRTEYRSEDQSATAKKIAADAAAKAKADKDAAALAKLAGGGGAGNKGMVDALTTAFQKFNTAVASAQSQFNKNSQNLLSQHIDNVAQVIAAKKGELNDAFKQAVQVDSGSLLAEVGGSITNMIAALRDKLSSAKKLSDDAGRLAGMGYSQEFVQQIIAQGPVMGDQLAQQLFNATPEQAAQVQDLLSKVTDFANTGVDSTAQKFATSQSFLVGALKDENTAYANSLNQLVRDNEVAMAKLQVSRDQAAIKALQAGGVTAAEAKSIRNYKSDIAAENKIVAAGGVTVNLSTTNLTSPQQTATEIVNAIKFNTPVTVTSGGAVTR